MVRFGISLWTVWVICSLAAEAAHGADTQRRHDPRIAALVNRLSGASFQDRLSAEDEFLQVGDVALPALQEALRSADPELRMRARQLITRIEQSGIQQQVKLFLEPNSRVELPGWSLLEDSIEDTPDNRKFYADLLVREPMLTQALRNPQRLLNELMRRQQDLGQTIFGASGTAHSPQRVAALLILLLHPDSNVPDLVRSDAARLLPNLSISGAVDSVADRFVLALAMKWVTTPSAGQAQLRFDLASRISRPEALIPALELIRQRPVPMQASQYFTAVARYGSTDEIAVMEELLTDSSEQMRRQQDETVRVQQVRDLALAALIELTQQNAEEYGLKPLERDASRRVRYLRPEFTSDEARDQALRKWREWSAANLKHNWPFPEYASEGTRW